MLGILYAPVENGVSHIEIMYDKGLAWVDRLQIHPLLAIDTWLSFFKQLYSGMAYGLTSAVIKLYKLDKLMNGLYYNNLPLLGVNRCIITPWRIILERYQDLSLPNFVVDCLPAKLYFV